MDRLTLFILLTVGVFCAFAGYHFAKIQSEQDFYEYRLTSEQKYREAVEARTKIEERWRTEVSQLQSSANENKLALEKRYQDLLQRLYSSGNNNTANDTDRMHVNTKGTGDSNALPYSAKSASGAIANQTDQQSRASSKVYRDALKKAKQRILWEAKERDICATHYNALLQIYLKVQGN